MHPGQAFHLSDDDPCTIPAMSSHQCLTMATIIATHGITTEAVNGRNGHIDLCRLQQGSSTRFDDEHSCAALRGHGGSEARGGLAGGAAGARCL